jgi:hypothetical protein
MGGSPGLTRALTAFFTNDTKTSKTLLTPDGHPLTCLSVAQMAELVDAPASGAGTRKGVEVRVLFWAPFHFEKHGFLNKFKTNEFLWNATGLPDAARGTCLEIDCPDENWHLRHPRIICT